jgi:hypothetical protein
MSGVGLIFFLAVNGCLFGECTQSVQGEIAFMLEVQDYSIFV